MAVVERFVNTASTAGGDGTTNATEGDNRAYATLSAAVADAVANKVQTDTWLIFCSGATADTTAADFNGIDAQSNGFVLVMPYPGEGHTGVWSSSKYRLEVDTSSYCVAISNPDIRLVGLQVKNISSASYPGIPVYAPATGGALRGYFERNIVWSSDITDNVTENAPLMQMDGPGIAWYISNNIFINDNDDNYARGLWCKAYTSYVYNNTVICPVDTVHGGITNEWQTGHYKNNLIYGHGTNFAFDNESTSNYAYNAINGTDNHLVGENNRQSQTFTFNGTNDWRLASNDQGAKGYGVDLGSDANYPNWSVESPTFGTLNFGPSIDIRGNTRSGTWDIGADWVSGVVSGPSKSIAEYLLQGAF